MRKGEKEIENILKLHDRYSESKTNGIVISPRFQKVD